MCGIVGYLGKNRAKEIVLSGLKSLEYRGYDSAGIGLINKEEVRIIKEKGPIKNLARKIKKIKSNFPLAIGHNRWATHGLPNKTNAHPHSDCQNEIFLVHNGIIENYKELKEILLKKGHRFKSETDSEVIAHLIEETLKNSPKLKLERALIEVLKLVRGAYALLVISKKEPEKIVFAKNSSPLVVGLLKKEAIIASDVLPVLPLTKKVIYLEDEEVGLAQKKGKEIALKIFSLKKSQRPLKKQISKINWGIKETQKGGFKHFMLKEIFEQPEVIRNVTRGRYLRDKGLVKLGGLELVKDELKKAKRIIIVACGTSYYAGLYGKYLLEELSQMPTEVYFGSEIRYHFPPLEKNEVILAVSQSGETADTLFAVKEAKRRGFLTLGLVNVVGSSIAREADAGVYLRAGPEIAVASTKSFLAQISAFVLLSLFLRNKQDKLSKQILSELESLPQKIEEVLGKSKEIEKLVRKYLGYKNFLFLGRKYNFPLALEGALKLKEISYLHAEGCAAGEMKHGHIAMIDENFLSLVMAFKDSLYEKMISTIEEIKARRGKVLALVSKKDKKISKIADDIISLPETLEIFYPFLGVIVCQLFAYYSGVLRGINVDKPRNLAKSVTVE